MLPGVPEREGRGAAAPPDLFTRGERGAVLPLAFHWDGNEVKRVLCSVAKISVTAVLLSFSAVILALVGPNSRF